MRTYFDLYIGPILNFKRHYCEETVPVPELSSVAALCKLLSILATPENGLPKEPEDIESYEYLAKLWFLFWLVVV